MTSNKLFKFDRKYSFSIDSNRFQSVQQSVPFDSFKVLTTNFCRVILEKETIVCFSCTCGTDSVGNYSTTIFDGFWGSKSFASRLPELLVHH